EGPGCYCYINNVLRKFLETLGGNYTYVVVDNEAGLEHLSRHNTGRADFLFIVVEPTITSLRAAGRISDLSEELGLVVKNKALIINRTGRMDDASDESLRKEREATGLEVAAEVPFDERLQKAEIDKVPFMDLENNMISLQAVDKLLEYIKSK
ncbi:MAG: carbon monoxide dehydrogenase, partial [Pseudomonadota bacterium]